MGTIANNSEFVIALSGQFIHSTKLYNYKIVLIETREYLVSGGLWGGGDHVVVVVFNIAWRRWEDQFQYQQYDRVHRRK